MEFGKEYIKTFDTEAQYNTFKASSGYNTPNVSYVTESNEVHYNPDPYKGHAYVDLGLPSGTKWATMNVGASSITDYGNYYKYGLGASQYDNAQTDYSGTENPLAASADTAVQVWGGQWHMPTQTQLNELIANTTYQLTTIDGIGGGKFTAQNGNYVFFPAAGQWRDGSQGGVGFGGYYWGSSPDGSSSAYDLYFYSAYGGQGRVSSNGRGCGCSVRPVVG